MKYFFWTVILILTLLGIAYVIIYRRRLCEFAELEQKSMFKDFAVGSKSDIEDGMNDNLLVKSKDLHNVLYDLRVRLQSSASSSPTTRFVKVFTNELSVIIPFTEHNIDVSSVIVRDADGLRINHDDLVAPNNDLTVTFTEPTSGTIFIL